MARNHCRITETFWFQPHVERLEVRLPFAADMLAIDLTDFPVLTSSSYKSSITAYSQSTLPQSNNLATASRIAEAEPTDYPVVVDLAIRNITSGQFTPPFTIIGLNETELSEADLTWLDEDRHLIVFVAKFQGTFGIYGRFSDGQTPADPFLVEQLDESTFQSSFGQPIHLSVTGLDAERAAVIWSSSIGVKGRIVNARTGLTVAAVPIDATTSVMGFDIDTFRGADGGFTVVWNNFETATVAIQSFASTGQGTTPARTVLQAVQGEFIAEVRAAAYSTNSLAIGWSVIDYNESSPGNFTRQVGNYIGIFASNGQATSPPIPLDFIETESLPSFADIGAGRWAIAVETRDETQSNLSVLTLDSEGNIQTEYTIKDVANLPENRSELVALSGGGFAISYFHQNESQFELVVQHFNSDGEPIGNPVPINQESLHGTPRGAITSTTDGGIAAYWIGMALDQRSPALMTRSLRMFSTELRVRVADPAMMLHPQDYECEIAGVPADAGLNHGWRLSPTSWIVPVDQLSDLRILSLDRLGELNLTATLIQRESGDIVETLGLTVGTADDDVFYAGNTEQVIDGREGIDTFLLDADSNAYSIHLVHADDPAVFTIELNGTNADEYASWTLIEVEAVQFNDRLVALGASISGFESNDEIDDAIDDLNDVGDESLHDGEDTSQEDQESDDDSNDSTSEPLLPPAGYNSASPLSNLAASNANSTASTIHNFVNSTGIPAAIHGSFESNVVQATVALDRATTANQPKEPSTKDSVKPAKQEKSKEKPKVEKEAVAEKEAAGEVDGAMKMPLPQNPNLSPSHENSNVASVAIKPPAILHQTPPQSFTPPITPPNVTQTVRQTLVPATPPIVGNKGPSSGSNQRFLNPILSVETPFDSEQLFAKIDEVTEEVAQKVQGIELVTGAAVVVATGFSIAQIGTLLRGSILITKLMSSMPVWSSFDPLPILSGGTMPELSNQHHESLMDIARAQS